jgi:PBSX family phage terminase large subunit
MALHRKQIEFLQSDYSRINILEGSVRSGKTFVLGFLSMFLADEFGKHKGAIIAKTLETLRENILDPLVALCPDAISYKDSGRRINIGGHKVRGVGANDESSRNKIQGDTLGWAIGDEVTLWPESFFKMLLSRLSVPNAKLFVSCNPDSPFHWLKRDYIDAGIAKTFHFDIHDNESLPPEYISALEKEYTGVWKQRYIFGQWVLAEGLIYDMVNDSHFVDLSGKKYQHYIAGIDYGTNNPCVFLLLGYNSDTDIGVVKEYYYDSNAVGRQKTDTQYKDDFIKFTSEIRPEITYIDPSAASFKLELIRAGFNVTDAINDVLPGIMTVSKKFAANHISIHNALVNLRKELHTYSWDPNAQKRGEDKPLKTNDHCPDALRYPVFSKFRGGAAVWASA